MSKRNEQQCIPDSTHSDTEQTSDSHCELVESHTTTAKSGTLTELRPGVDKSSTYEQLYESLFFLQYIVAPLPSDKAEMIIILMTRGHFRPNRSDNRPKIKAPTERKSKVNVIDRVTVSVGLSKKTVTVVL